MDLVTFIENCDPSSLFEIEDNVFITKVCSTP